MRFYTFITCFTFTILSLKLCLCAEEQSSSSLVTTIHKAPKSLVPLWKRNTRMKLYIFVNNEYIFNDYKAAPNWEYHLQNNEQQEYMKQINIHPIKNGVVPLYAHIFLVKDSFPIDPTNKSFSIDSIVYVCHGLTKYYDHRAYWHNSITISLVHDTNDYISKDALHPVTLAYFLNNQGHQRNQHIAFYRPVVFPNDFWLIKEDAHLINDTISILPLTIHLETINLWKFNVYAVLAAEKSDQQDAALTSIDETKRMMLTANPSFMLGFTLVTCLFHGLFEFLAFKNDVLFWLNKRNRIGVSVNSIIINIILQVVLFIYFMDFSNHSIRVLGHALSISMEVWKLHRLFRYEYDWTCIIHKEFMTTVKLVRVVQPNSMVKQKGENITSHLDTTALHFMIYITAPFYIICNVFYGYTFIDFLNDFGYFIVIGPQLYINYHMDMVNHVSVNSLFYKFMNIGIDDLFAYVIGMPITQRLSCAKDSVIYLVYYSQKTRVIKTLTNQLKKNKKAF